MDANDILAEQQMFSKLSEECANNLCNLWRKIQMSLFDIDDIIQIRYTILKL